MLDQDFCAYLEYELTKALANSPEPHLKSLWCDGILAPEFDHEYGKKFVNDKREVVMLAFLGKKGQEEYELTLRFGRMALSRFARDLEIASCVPSPDASDWFDVDVEKRKIWVQLD